MLKRFLHYYKPYKKMLALDMLASLFISLMGMVYPIVTNKMLNDFIPGKQYKLIVGAGILVLILYVARMFLRYFVQYYGHMIGVKMQSDMRVDLFTHLQKLPYTFFDNNETGKLMTRLTSDLFEVTELAHHGPENLLISSAMLILSFVYLLTIDWILTLIIFACVPILILVTARFRKDMKTAFADRRKSNATINAAAESSITGIRVTKAYTNGAWEIKKFKKGDREFVNSSRDAYSAMAKYHSSSTFITDIFNVFILIAGGLFLYAGRINFGDYSTFIVSVNLFINPITTLIGFMEQYQNGVSGFKRFVEIMDQPAEADPPHPVPFQNPKGDIVFQNLSFSYNQTGEVLKNVNLHIGSGEKVALVGPSGGGKTTLCHLLPKFYSPEEGEGAITIDGVDIRGISTEDLRKSIGIVQQDVFLFGGTIGENILYGNPNATHEQVVQAAKKANIHEFIMGLEHGYHTQIGERGVKLSGGQKQRVSIARVFLKNPAILILDEATSALDNTTELLIQKSLDELCEGRTTLVVAHRLSTIRNAHRIAVVMNGQIKEQGTHEELLATGGIYKELYSLQFRENQET